MKRMVCLLMLCAFLVTMAGCASDNQTEETTAATMPTVEIAINTNRSLRLGVTEEAGTEHVNNLAPNEGSAFETRICYVGIADAAVEVDGKAVPLDYALRENLITLEQMLGYARVDAHKDLCQEFVKNRKGKSFFVYRYPEYELRFTDDFTYTEAGNTYPVNELYLCRNHYDVDTGVPVPAEEYWGLSFAVVEASDTSITLDCTQSGGEQLGELIADYYYIDLPDQVLTRLEGIEDTGDYQPKPVLERDAVSRITLDWTDIYGSLPAGEYLMTLRVQDASPEESQMLNEFEDHKSYVIPFTIP